ncbi:hypothetical protein [uncultured Roseobacter sp.]|uniref:hypothetical protein n=1 Tax=uncultured Roseobacter sp. TaxID=114847 RepID=UPI002631D018|nr:hypothetical protein [uncultured Roseobacter sp.]
MDGVGALYGQDSFFTLSTVGQIGLAAVSAFLSFVMIWGASRLARHRAWVWRCALALVAFWLFVWLSPQIYYFYYLILFDGLPVQWIVKTAPGPMHLLRLLTFTSDANLSHHSQGALGWMMIIAALWPQRNAPVR